MFDPVWRCKDGRHLKVGQMSTEHLLNSIHKIRRSGGWRIAWLPRLELELVIRRVRNK